MPEETEYKPIDLAREDGFQLGAIRVSPASREVIVEGQAQSFEPRVMQVLVALAQRRGSVVSREELSARCWKGRAVGDDALNRCIAHLRRLADASGNFKVETIPRVGYRLTTAEEPAGCAQPRASSMQLQAADVPRSWRRKLVAISLAILSITVVGVYLETRDSRRVAASLEDRTFVVLPFAALNDDADSRRFAQGISASITDVLSRAGQRVVSPAQAQKFHGADRTRVTEATGARFIVDGEVGREGNVISVVLRVEDGRTGRTLMSNVFKRDAADSGGLADVVAGYVGVRSWLYLPSAIKADHPEVDDAGYRAAEMLANGKSRAAYDLAAAMARKYPDDVQALVQFAAISTTIYWALEQDEVAPAMRAARVAAERVTHVAPDYGDIYAVLSSLMPPQHWAQREALLRKGLARDPDTRFAGHILAGLLGEVGRLRDAEQVERGEVGRDPFNLVKIQRHLTLLGMVGNRTDAAVLVELGNRYVPGNAELALSRFMASDFRGAAPEVATMMMDPAIAAIIEPSERQPKIRVMLRALDSRRTGDMDAAVAGCTSEWVSTQTTLTCLVGMSALGRLDDAFAFASDIYSDQRDATPALEDQEWLRRERGFSDTTMLYRPELAPMRADARFITLAARVRLLDYWRTGHPPDFCKTELVPVCQAIGNP
jgi:DNA-binding winged helix-turn-helix (wHTH) protein/TolB-like protein